MIELGIYRIKPWYFSPYPQVIKSMETYFSFLVMLVPLHAKEVPLIAISCSRYIDFKYTGFGYFTFISPGDILEKVVSFALTREITLSYPCDITLTVGSRIKRTIDLIPQMLLIISGTHCN